MLEDTLLRNVVERLGIAGGAAAVRFRHVARRWIGWMLGQGIGAEQVGAAARAAIMRAAPDFGGPVGRRAVSAELGVHLDDHRAGLRLVDEFLLAPPADANWDLWRLHGDDRGVGGGVVGAVVAVTARALNMNHGHVFGCELERARERAA